MPQFGLSFSQLDGNLSRFNGVWAGWIQAGTSSSLQLIPGFTLQGVFVRVDFLNGSWSGISVGGTTTITFGDIYTGKLLDETASHWRVEATPREDVKVIYGKLVFTIRKDYKQASQVQYFNQKGNHTKTENRTEYSCQGEICNAGIMTMIDHTRGDAATEFQRREWQVNTGVSDSLFSKRNLQP